MKKYLLAFLFVGTLFSQRIVYATIVVEFPLDAREILDTDRDGNADVVRANGGTVTSNYAGSFSYTGIEAIPGIDPIFRLPLEFLLPSDVLLNSAIFKAHEEECTTSGKVYDIFSYTGDGVISVGDWDATSLIGSYVCPSSGQEFFSFDVTSFVSSIISDVGDSYAGFLIKARNEFTDGSLGITWLAASDPSLRPSLILDVSVSNEVIPEPSTVIIFGLGLLGLIFRPASRMI